MQVTAFILDLESANKKETKAPEKIEFVYREVNSLPKLFNTA